ncbi:hypothetical protein AFULGI_00006870 [Archaeoglobus fulgidus DSM 8774]|uniref:Uncharacterized protein n=1 Tax=Archaeoglobus fulgidus DSM 8774 TaxID=1344584 RepID=A0A075WIT7_ARCFL|nr:hypothetical protein [Archaeoglobus fulgidus]AIG97488.1 hypothetical protein AFULGI_00006870 [Archaeoglobus fulgidus DSM 8774]
MGKIIQIEVPDWVDEDILIELRKAINEKLKNILLYKRFEDLIEKIGLSEEDLKAFEETRKRVWAEIKEIYKREGLIND